MPRQTCAELFRSQGYTKVESALSAELCDLLAKYVCLKAQANPKIINREYGDLMMETLLAHLQVQVETATGLSLWPTLSFCYMYKNGNALKPHKDRASCEIVAGLSLRYSAMLINMVRTHIISLINAKNWVNRISGCLRGCLVI